MTDATKDSFDYHTPTAEQQQLIANFRATAKAMRDTLEALPASREKSLSVTRLEEALMWANKAAVR